MEKWSDRALVLSIVSLVLSVIALIYQLARAGVI